jgi:hypothetical protein
MSFGLEPARVTCPGCGQEIPATDLSVSTDLASCKACDLLFKVSEHVEPIWPDVDLEHPPAGVHLKTSPDGFQLSATTRSAGGLMLVPFALVWSGGSIGGIYGSQVAAARFDPGMALFGLPFLIAGVLLWRQTLMSVLGLVRVTRSGDRAQLFLGIGPVGMHKDFRWSEVAEDRRNTAWTRRATREGNPRREFAAELESCLSMLSGARRQYVVLALGRLGLVLPSGARLRSEAPVLERNN